MTRLTEELQALQQAAKERIPADALSVMGDETAKLKASGIEGQALKAGAAAPDFVLQNHIGQSRTLSGLLAEGPVVLSFYRGGW
ncbi:hypothetical protein [Oleidesulfovibrio sp.]|uniref:hypothetical protein n=1 Tax=Oleidesulfovibrio sp. TaxID=2909707 RepID=UPI003A866AED